MRTRTAIIVVTLFVSGVLPRPAAAQDLAIVNARILDGKGAVIERGAVIVRSGKIVIKNALFPHPFGLGYASVDSLVMPWCTFTSPEIAHVGLYEAEAAKRGLKVETYTHKFDEVDRAILDGDEEGFARIHIQQGTDTILGATIVGAHAGDLISEVAVAMKAGAGAKTIAATIHPYPTRAEIIKKAVNLWRKAHFTPRTKALLTKLFAWLRR